MRLCFRLDRLAHTFSQRTKEASTLLWNSSTSPRVRGTTVINRPWTPIDVEQRLADAEFRVGYVQEIGTAQEPTQHLPILPVQGVIGAVAMVRFKEQGDGAILRHGKLVHQLEEVRTVILAVAPAELHRSPLLSRVGPAELDRSCVLVDLA